jgi:hypothetical protein
MIFFLYEFNQGIVKPSAVGQEETTSRAKFMKKEQFLILETFRLR